MFGRRLTVAVCLQTADRPDYTARTLASFAAHNDLDRCVLLHGDDASSTPENLDLAGAYGFRTVSRPSKPVGGLALRSQLLQYAATVADWVLLLENDILSVRPLPWPLIEFVAQHPWVYALRLFGEFKGPDRTDPCLTVNKWHREKPVRWKTLRGAPEPAEHAVIHWSAQPTVTRAAQARDIHVSGHRELHLKTVRVVQNVMVHVGATRTHQVRRQTEEVAC
jgi:hypothetical protein